MNVIFVTSERSAYTVGRDPGSDLVLTDCIVSRRHLLFNRITHDVAKAEVTGTNGAIVNGEKVDKGYKCYVRSGDCIRIGGYALVWIGGRIPERNILMRHLTREELFDMEPVEIEGPPQRKIPEKPSVMLAALPALTMAIPILLGAGRSIAILSSLFAALWAAVNVIGRVRKQRAEEKRRRSTYLSYLAECEKTIQSRLKDISAHLSDINPEVGEFFKGGGAPFILWNDLPGPDGSLAVRIGRGNIINPLSIVIPREHFAGIYDSLKELPGKLQKKYEKIPSSPVLAHLRRKSIAGVVLSEERDRQKLTSMILQIAATYPPDAVRIVPRLRPETLKAFMWLTWLPHYLNGMSCESFGEETTYVVLADDVSIAYESVSERSCVIFVCDPAFSFPPGVYRMTDNDTDLSGMLYDMVPTPLAFSYAACMSRLWSKEEPEDVPETVPFGTMYDSIDSEAIIRYYSENDICASISAPIGKGAGNRNVYLDLHERSAGPHGVIAGTTGSGKSELLTTMILSYAIRYPPDKLAFFLIDYKGGGMSNMFAALPHLAGSISNLSRSATRRAMIALKSENLRRQEIFAECGVNNINDYTRLYDKGDRTEPLPHVLVIVDEFAELRKEEPEFMDRLISISQVGRSLGIHLILATQKPAGVVDDKIRSNTGFRIALRLAMRSDSMDMLHRPDAADIKECGRAYLQIGGDDEPECFQSGYAMGCSDMSRDGPKIYEDFLLEKEIFETDIVNDDTDAGESWYDIALRAVKEACAAYRSPRAPSLFLPPLPAVIEDDEAFAVFDNPYRQRYERMVYEPVSYGNVWITGRSGSGKSELVRSMLRNVWDKAAVYVIDHGGGVLAGTKDLAFCGGYVPDDHPDDIVRMTGYIIDEVTRRRRGRNADDHALVLVLDDYQEIVSAAGDEAEEQILRIMTTGRSVDVFVIATSASAPKPKLAKLIDTGLYMGCDDAYAASEFLKASVRDIPVTADITGRGVGVIGGLPLEFQGVLTKEYTGKSPPGSIVAERFPHVPRSPDLIRFMEQAFAEATDDLFLSGIPVGYEEKSGRLYVLPTGHVRCILIGGKPYNGRHTLLFNISILMARCGVNCVHADTYEALDALIERSEGLRMITISNVTKLLDEFYDKKRSEEEEDKLASYFDNVSSLKDKSDGPVIVGVVDNGLTCHRGRKVYDKMVEHPYGIHLGGDLGDNRIFDFSYLPFSDLQKSHRAGYATILKYDEKSYFGPVILPGTINVDNSQSR